MTTEYAERSIFVNTITVFRDFAFQLYLLEHFCGNTNMSVVKQKLRCE